MTPSTCPKNTTGHYAFFLPALNGGGAERVFVNLANYYSEHGYKIDMLLMKKEGAYLSSLSPDIKVFELGGKGILGTFFPLIRYMREETPDTVVSVLQGPNTILPAAGLCMRILGKRIRTVISQRVAYSTYILAGIDPLKDPIRHILARLFFPRADAITVNSIKSAQDLARSCSIDLGRIKVIYNPVDLEDIQNKARDIPAHPWFTGKDAPVMVCAGRLDPQKGFLVILEALRHIPDLRLVILGEGPQETEIRAFIKQHALEDRVYMPGFVDNPYSYMAHADLFVLASLFEGLPNVLIEALATGVAVVSTDCESGPSEILQDGQYGPLVTPGDAKSLRKAIEASLHAPVSTKEKRLERAADFRLDKIAAEFLAVLKGG